MQGFDQRIFAEIVKLIALPMLFDDLVGFDDDAVGTKPGEEVKDVGLALAVL